LTLQRAHGFVAEDIDAVEIITFHESTRLATTAPETTEEAQYSTAFPVALALAHGRLGPDEVQGALLRAPPVRALAARVTMAEDDHANAVFPAERLARAVITLKNGARHESEWHTAKWDPANPPSQDELIEKFRDYTGAALSRARADEIIATVLDLENRPAEALFALIRG
ncbi:MAG: MmgE/PrpD family protein, partial [Pseudomonadota bacterium]